MIKLELSNLPASALERINQIKEQKGHFFTSDLSVNEFLLIKQIGFEPLGLVMGSSVYHIGFQMVNFFKNQEMEVLTQAMYHSRELAMSRMQAEAEALGADGIVAVRLTFKHQENMIEFMAVGTAVSHKDGHNYRSKDNRPFTSDLSGQDFWTLLRAGYRPLGMVMGNCVYHIAHQMVQKWATKVIGKNVELKNFTQGLYHARELAMERMQAEAIALSAEGIVGVEVHESNYNWSTHLIEFFSIGTAIAAISDDHKIPVPNLVFNINN